MGKKNVVIAGAGKIGRGYLAELFQEGGYHTTFLVHSPKKTEQLRAQGSYIIFRGNKEETAVEEVMISGYDAYCTETEQAQCVQALVDTQYAMLPVYPVACPDLGKLLAQAINRKAAESPEEAFDIYMCVNFLQSTKIIRECILPHLDEAGKAYFDKNVGITETLVGRLVVDATPEMLAKDPLAISAGYGDSLYADPDALKAGVPEGVRVGLQDRLGARFTYKIWSTNMKHFAVSLYGSYLGYTYVREATIDPYAEKCVREMADNEAVYGVAAEYGLTAEEVKRDFARDPWATWSNPESNDGFARVVFDMRRKLSKPDRVIGPALACLKGGKIPFFLASIAALAMIYHNLEDPTSCELKEILEKDGVFGVLREFSGLSEEDKDERMLMELIRDQYIALNK